MPTLEDKLVQGAVAEALSAIHEVDFLGFSYGFRPGRHPHGARAKKLTAEERREIARKGAQARWRQKRRD